MSNRITAVTIQKNNKNRVNIYIDNEYVFSCDTELVYRYKLNVGNQVDAGSIQEIAESDNYTKAKNDALRLIARSYKTEQELLDKLFSKGYDESIARKVLGFLQEYNFIDDKKYTEMFVNDRIKTKGKNKIKYELLRKGIDEQTINETIHSLEPEREADVAFELGMKKYNVLIKRETDGKKIKQKLYQFLISRGYSWEVSKNVSDRILRGDSLED